MATISVKMIPKGRIIDIRALYRMIRFGPDDARQRQMYLDWETLVPENRVMFSSFADQRALDSHKMPRKIEAALTAAAIRDGLVECQVIV